MRLGTTVLGLFSMLSLAAQTPADLELLDEAIAHAPDEAANYLRRGALYETARRYPLALADLERAIALEPRRAETYQQRGIVHFKMVRASRIRWRFRPVSGVEARAEAEPLAAWHFPLLCPQV